MSFSSLMEGELKNIDNYFSLHLYLTICTLTVHQGTLSQVHHDQCSPIFPGTLQVPKLYIHLGGKCIVYVFHSVLNNLHVILINNCLRSLLLQVPWQKNFFGSCNFRKNHHFYQNINSQTSQFTDNQ